MTFQASLWIATTAITLGLVALAVLNLPIWAAAPISIAVAFAGTLIVMTSFALASAADEPTWVAEMATASPSLAALIAFGLGRAALVDKPTSTTPRRTGGA
jgi:hypothetical protein